MTDAVLQPTAPQERIATLDVLRGFALGGILLMNMESFVGPVFQANTGMDPGLAGADRIADGLVYFFIQGKFFTLFSLLFGMGFAIMAQRAEAAARPFAGLYWRRSLALLGIGLAHSLLVWSGDILVPYIKVTEPLRLECLHFLDCVRTRRQPVSDGYDGLRVVKVLDAAQRSLKVNGEPVKIAPLGG